tara:strand:- start:716 stop:1603 length:888 start_codon:yes stop_codon:yes gene_type:complete
MAEWFRRQSAKIKTTDKLEIVEGTWLKCPQCQEVLYRKMLKENRYICNGCNHHFRITIADYVDFLLDDGTYKEISKGISSGDPLSFEANKKYVEQIHDAKQKTGNLDAIKTIYGKVDGTDCVFAVMDFSFIGGSMGSVVGEKISKAIDFAIANNSPLVIITASGGARMQEGAYSLMQMAKICTKLAYYSEMGGFYVSILTDPTTGGTTASFAMLGDIILAEPNALIGFAGARVIKQTIGEDLPEGFQRSEFLMKKGFIDRIVDRHELKQTLSHLFNFFEFDIINKNKENKIEDKL